jgi:apolipoprotein N-acyltransferase
MGFAAKWPALVATIAVLSTAALFLAGNGMEPLWPFMWFAPIPVLLLAAVTSSWRIAAGAAAASMLLGSVIMLYYLHFVLRAPVIAWLIPFSIASLLFAAGVLLFRGLLLRGAVMSAVIALPAFWTVCEYLASFVPANGTAGSLAYTQERFLPMLQVASLTGPWGITFLLLLFPSAIAAGLFLRRRNRSQAISVVASMFAVVAIAVLFGVVRLACSNEARQNITVGLLKTGLLLDQDATIVDPILQSVADRTGATLVIGVQHVVAGNSFNEARIYTPGQSITTYDKQHMLPPFESNLTPGNSLTMLSKPAFPIGVAICKDMDFIHPALEYGRAGIDLLLDPAWDFNIDRTWHGHIAIMRGVEGGYAIAHAAKNGLLTVTDDRGRILSEVRTGGGGFTSLLVNVPLRHDQTVFVRYGTWFPWVAGLLVLATAARLVTLWRFR